MYNDAYRGYSRDQLIEIIERDRERAIAAEVQRLESLTVRELLAETDVVRVTFTEVVGGPLPDHGARPFALDLGALFEALADRNVSAAAELHREAA